MAQITGKGNHPAFSKQFPKFLEKQAILRYKAEHGGLFQQARAGVIIETPRSVSSRSFTQALKPSRKLTSAVQPKASGKVSSSAIPKGQNAQRSPNGAVSCCPSEKPRACKSLKGEAPRVKIFGTTSDMDTEIISDFLYGQRLGEKYPAQPTSIPWSVPFPFPD